MTKQQPQKTHTAVTDCIREVHFDRTRNGGRPHVRQAGGSQIGDCGVVALSIAADVKYPVALHRIRMVAKTLQDCADIRPELVHVNERDPIYGTNRCVMSWSLTLHDFKKATISNCICSSNDRYVAVGETDNGDPHTTAIIGMIIPGMHDVTRHDFKVEQLWKADKDSPDKWQNVTQTKLNECFRAHFVQSTLWPDPQDGA